MFESRKRHHLSRAPLALTPGGDKPEGASAWELRGYAVGSGANPLRFVKTRVRRSNHLKRHHFLPRRPAASVTLQALGA